MARRQNKISRGDDEALATVCSQYFAYLIEARSLSAQSSRQYPKINIVLIQKASNVLAISMHIADIFSFGPREISLWRINLEMA